MRLRLMLLSVVALVCRPATQPPPAKVNVEELVVRAEASESAQAVKTLKRGDSVHVEFTVEITGASWCGIAGPGGRPWSGYVPCDSLERAEAQPGPATVPTRATPDLPPAAGAALPEGPRSPPPARRPKPDPAVAAIDKGLALLRSGQVNNAIAEFNRALEISPQSGEAYLQRAIANARLGHLEKAVKDCDESIRLDPRQPASFTTRGLLHDRLGRHDLAVKDHTEAIKLAPAHPNCYLNRAASHLLQGQYASAIPDLDKAIRLAPAPVAYYNRGLAYAHSGRDDAAIRDCTQALRLSSTYAEAHACLGLAYEHLDQPAQAIRHYEEASRLNPREDRYLLSRAAVAAGLARTKHSLESLNEAVEKAPAEAGPYVRRGAWRHRNGELDRALRDYTAALRLDSRFAAAYGNRALIYAAAGEKEKARRDLEICYALDPGMRSVYEVLMRQIESAAAQKR